MINSTQVHQKKGYLPFGYKLMITYMVFIIIPVSLIGLVAHSMYEKSIKEHTEVNLQGTLLQIRDNIEFKVMEIERISRTLYRDHTLVSQLRSYEEGWDNYDRTAKIIMPKLDIALNSTGMNLWLSAYFYNESIPEVYHITLDTEQQSNTFNIFHMNRILHETWYKNHPPEKYDSTVVWKQIENDLQNKRISMLRRLVDNTSLRELKEIGFMRLNISILELFQSVEYSKIGPGSVLLIKDEQGQILYQSGAMLDGEGTIDQPSSNYLTIRETLSDPRWEIIALVPMTIIERDSFKVKIFIIAMCLLCMIVFTFAGLFISRYFSVRITKFISVLNAFREGDLHKRIRYRGNDEFSQIAVALNEMGENIGDLIKEVYLSSLHKKEAELEALQSQINPHFLYNTLSSINRLAKFGETEKLQLMVMELAKFYRLTLNEGRMFIPVPSEIEQANAYLVIQKIKYMDRMDVMWDIDPAVWPYETIKLIIQPFLENVFKHAWVGDRIHIRIVAQLEQDCIRLRIIDDGVGMTQDRINQIFDPKDHVNGGYGIRNVDQRIKLQYGSEYGISIYSRLGIGTSIDIRIPARRGTKRPHAEP